jgi:hypothetical protein
MYVNEVITALLQKNLSKDMYVNEVIITDYASIQQKQKDQASKMTYHFTTLFIARQTLPNIPSPTSLIIVYLSNA